MNTKMQRLIETFQNQQTRLAWLQQQLSTANLLEYLSLAETFLEKTLHLIYENSDKSLAKEKLSKQGELFQAYADLYLRLQDAFELTAFEDLIPELEQEAKDIEAILEAIAPFAGMTYEHDWRGAFITIRGTTIISGGSWLERSPEKDFEDIVIQGVSDHLHADFSCTRCYSTYHAYNPYDSYSKYQQEMTIYVNDFYAYGRLKDEVGYHTLFKTNKRMEIFVEILPVVALPSVIEETELFPFMVYGAGGPSVNRTLSGAYIVHLPTRIKAQTSEAKAFLFNREIASMLLQSRLFAHHSGIKQQKPRYSYLWDNQQMIDHSKHEIYPFSQTSGFANTIIKALEKSSKFQEK